MVKTLVLSFGTLSLAALGAVGLRGGDGEAAARDGGCCAKEAACSGTRPATLECHDGRCLVTFKTDDGRDGVIELACEGGTCKVVRCEPCCGDECKAPASEAATACPPSNCCGSSKSE